MDEERLQPHSHFHPNQSGKRVDNGGDDRLSALPNEVLLLILSLLPMRRAASTTILSSRWLDLWKQIPNLKSDRISQLPDRIISLILSFLPLKIAGATSVLSSRWSDSWKHTPYLNIDDRTVSLFDRHDQREDVYMCMAMVNSILQSHKAFSLKQFRIYIYVDKSSKWAVTKWLEFAFSRKVENLELDFVCWPDRDRVVLGESLREINAICEDPRSLIFFQSLKSLHLVCLKMSGDDVKLFVHNCPLLEQVMIRAVTLTSDIEICGSSLKSLEMYVCKGGKSIKVSAPSLAFVRFDDSLVKLLFENAPGLVEAVFEMNNYRAKVVWSSALHQMPNLKKLTIICFKMYKHSLLHAMSLLWASPRLQEFKLMVSDEVQFNGYFCEYNQPLFLHVQYIMSHKATTANMQAIANVGRSPHQHLREFHLHLHYPCEHNRVVELVTYISNNCVALRQIVIHGPEDSAPLRLLQSQLPNHVQLSIRPL